MNTKKMALAVIGACVAAWALPAAAQVDGIATVSPVIAIAGSKAFNDANGKIAAMYKPQLDQADAKQKQRQPLLAQLDKNGDKQVDDAELAAASAAKSPALAQLDALDKDIAALTQPALLAQAYAIEQIGQKYDAAQSTVIAARKISVILTPDSFVYAPPAVDVTTAITAEIDRTLPTVSISPPANWQPQRSTMQALQQIQQLQQIQAARAAAAGGPAPTGPAPAPTQPATPGKKPATR